jgi:hypothetical protein
MFRVQVFMARRPPWLYSAVLITMKTLFIWPPTITDLVTLLIAGAGWWQFVMERKKRKRDRTLDLLEHFLSPLDFVLSRNKSLFKDLQKGLESLADRLEYYPQKLKHDFDSLPLSDPRRLFWRVEIEKLHANNDEAIRLIKANIGSTLLNGNFVTECKNLEQHVSGWRKRWDYVLNNAEVPKELEGQRISETFPVGFDAALRDQIAQTRKQAGLKNKHTKVSKSARQKP